MDDGWVPQAGRVLGEGMLGCRILDFGVRVWGYLTNFFEFSIINVNQMPIYKTLSLLVSNNF